MDRPGNWPVRKSLWKAGGLLGLLVLTIVVANLFLPPEKAFNRHMYGHDFLPFYTAGQLVRQGRWDHLYDPQATAVLEHQTTRQAALVIHNEYGAFLNPPFAALPAAWLARWTYATALSVWTAFLFISLTAALWLLVRLLPPTSGWRSSGLIPLLLFTALPAWQALLHAQNTFFSLLVLAGAVTFWRSDKPLRAGLVAGLLLFKPQLGALLAVVLIVTQGRRALLGFAITAAALLSVTLIALPGALGNYLHQLPANLRAIQVLPNYTWHRHVTFLAWWRMLLQGHAGALPTPLVKTLATGCAAALAATLAAAVWNANGDQRRAGRLIAATITTMPLLMPYYMDYDLTLLSVAAVLCAIDAIEHGVDRTLLLTWTVFYAVVEINAATAGATPIIPAVPALAVLSVISIRRVLSPIEINRAAIPETPREFALAA